MVAPSGSATDAGIVATAGFAEVSVTEIAEGSGGLSVIVMLAAAPGARINGFGERLRTYAPVTVTVRVAVAPPSP